MQRPFSENTVQILLFQVAPTLAQALQEVLTSAQANIAIEQIDTHQVFQAALPVSHWDVMIATYPVPPESLALLQPVERQIPLILLCESAQADAAFALAESAVHDVLPITELKRLPFILRRELRLHALETQTSASAATTEPSHAITALQRSELRFRTIIEGFSDIILMLDGYQMIRYTNAALTRRLGLRTSALLGKSLSAFLHPDEVAVTMKMLTELAHSADAVLTLEHRIQRADQTWESVETTGRCITDPSGQPMLLLHMRSLTEQKMAEALLRKSEERFRLLVQSVEDYAIFLLDQNGCVTSWNAGAERLKGYRYDEIIGQDYVQFFIVADQQAGKPQHLLAAAQSHGHSEDEGWRVRKDGTRFWVRSGITALWNEDGSLYGFAAITHDLTHRKHAEEHIRKLNRTLAVLSDTNQAIVRIRDLPTLFTNICQIAVEKGGLPMAWLGVINPVTRQIELAAQAGATDEYLQELALFLNADYTHHFFTTLLSNGRHIVCNDIERDPHFAAWRTTALRFGYRALAVFPLMLAHTVAGLLTLYSSEPDYFDADELQLLDEMAMDVAFAMTVAEQEEQRVQAERARQASEERYRRVVEDQTEMICRFDKDFRLTFVNRAYCLLHQRRPEELLGKTLFEILSPAVQEAATTYLTTLTPANPTAIFEQCEIMPDQTRRWLQWRDRVLLDATGKIVEYQGVGRDITEQKRAEAELARYQEHLEQLVAQRTTELSQAKERVEAILNNSTDGILLVQSDLTIQQANTAFSDLFACTPAAYQEQSLLTFVHADDTDKVINTIGAVMADGKGRSLEICTRRQDDTLFDAELSVGYIDSVNNQTLGAVCTLRDITKRKRADAALRESEEKFRLLVEAAPIAIVITDQAGAILLVNRQAELLFAYQSAELVGQPVEMLMSPIVRAAHSRQRAVYSTAPRVRQMGGGSELFAQRKDGSPLPVEIELSYIETSAGLLVMTFIVDITERKAREDQLRKAFEKEKELGELKSRFVSMASHEFRTPLATILALSETLSAYRHRMTDDQIKLRLDRIRDQVGHLQDIMEDVLQLARLQARRAEFNPMALDLDDLCRTVIAEFESQPHELHHLVYISTARRRAVTLDKKLMRQIINNLVSNALKYSPADTTVTVRLEDRDRTLLLSVHDEGIGIPAADLQHLFEPFHRAANVENIAGTGLGLTITKEAIELHGGTIAIESEVGLGTTFIVSLPVMTN